MVMIVGAPDDAPGRDAMTAKTRCNQDEALLAYKRDGHARRASQMRIVLLGPPGAGKGTQAAKLQQKLGIPQISTGELFRRNISKGTRLGMEAKRYLDSGELVPSELTNRLVDDRVNYLDVDGGFILDGYPRSVEQAKVLRGLLARRGLLIDAV